MDSKIQAQMDKLATLDAKIAECRANGETLMQFHWNDMRNDVLAEIANIKKKNSKGKRAKRTGFARSHVVNVELSSVVVDGEAVAGSWAINLKDGSTISGSVPVSCWKSKKYPAETAHDAVVDAHPTLNKLPRKKFVYA